MSVERSVIELQYSLGFGGGESREELLRELVAVRNGIGSVLVLVIHKARRSDIVPGGWEACRSWPRVARMHARPVDVANYVNAIPLSREKMGRRRTANAAAPARNS